MVRPAAAGPLLVLASLLVAGCADGGGDGTGTSTTTTAPAQDPCPTVTEASTVPAWTRHGGHWGQIAARDGRLDLVCGKAMAPLDRLTNDLAGPLDDFELTVSFNMLLGDFGLSGDGLGAADAGAGVVIHHQDAGNSTIVRYSPREQGWHLFTIISGNRDKVDDASVTPPTTNPEYGEWVDLRVRSEGGHVTAFHNTTKVIDYQLPDLASREGLVGYFLRDAGMVALFDDFAVLPLA